MILVDTSVWIEYLRRGDDRLAALLDRNLVAMHPFVTGELACGNLQNRETLLRLFQNLPQSPVATHEEVMHFIQQRELMGRGIGYVDAHLLAAVALEGDARLWTRDKRLHAVANELNLAWGQT
ncbi:MAG TPA: type II toxin-antitoxin system VapC family toxin [Chloroflexi bacterium]|nr:type II toxin-antitoxin system VapC family toxin [Chloroflexota bacterium]